jgi:hypothetical protein
MLNGSILANVLDSRIGDAAVVIKKRRKPSTGYVAALVDCGGQYGATILSVPYRIVGTAPEE